MNALGNLPAPRPWEGRLGARARQTREARRARGDRPQARPMILVDTGPFVALFDPADASHSRCAADTVISRSRSSNELRHRMRAAMMTSAVILILALMKHDSLLVRVIPWLNCRFQGEA